MVVGKKDLCLRPQSEIGEKHGTVEDIMSGGARSNAELETHVTQLRVPAPRQLPQSLVKALPRVHVGVVAPSVQRAGSDDDIDVAALGPANAEHFREGTVWEPARTLNAVQSLLGHCGDQCVVVEQRRGGIMIAMM
jgi:hypothetical protein